MLSLLRYSDATASLSVLSLGSVTVPTGLRVRVGGSHIDTYHRVGEVLWGAGEGLVVSRFGKTLPSAATHSPSMKRRANTPDMFAFKLSMYSGGRSGCLPKCSGSGAPDVCVLMMVRDGGGCAVNGDGGTVEKLFSKFPMVRVVRVRCREHFRARQRMAYASSWLNHGSPFGPPIMESSSTYDPATKVKPRMRDSAVWLSAPTR